MATFASGWLDAVRTREDAYPTGLAMPAANIAIPHTDPGFVAKPYIAVVKPAAPVTFNAMAGMGAPVPARIVINLGIAEPGGQVEALQALMNIFYGRRCRSRRSSARPRPGAWSTPSAATSKRWGLSRHFGDCP